MFKNFFLHHSCSRYVNKVQAFQLRLKFQNVPKRCLTLTATQLELMEQRILDTNAGKQ
jgi:hypothetical protein